MSAAEEMSKSAKRRAAKKARDAAAAEEAAPAPAPAPKAAASAPAGGGGYPAAEPKAKAKAKAKAEAAAPAPAAPEPKAKAKAKAKAEAAPEPQPKAKGKAKAAPAPPPPEPEPKAAAKSKSAKKKTEPKPEPTPEPIKRQTSGEPLVVLDDGSGDPWEVCTGLTKKAQKAKDRQEEMKRAQKEAGPQAVGGKIIPGMAAASAPAQRIPGMAGPVSQSVNAPAAALAAAKAAAAAAGQSAAAAAAAASGEGGGKPDTSVSATIKVPDNKIGIVIGPKGSKIKMIQEKTGVTRIDTSGEVFTIMGPADCVGMAEMAINDLITKGYTALAYDDFSENYVMVHPNFFPDLIGKQGVVIRKMKDELGVEMTIPKTGPAGKKWKVSIAGSAKNVEKAKEVITEIVTHYHHEITHPGEAHVEMEIPEWCYAWIIGKAGSELRHIQNNFKVRVNIPRAGISENDKVVIVGAPHDVTRAETYITKVLANSEEQMKGRGREDKAEDPWGDEEPEEQWMSQYMYKRK